MAHLWSVEQTRLERREVPWFEPTGQANASAGASRRCRPVPPREHLRRQVRRQVRRVAAAATSETDFFTRLAHAGVKVRLRYSIRRPGEVTGYAVGMNGHLTATGETVWYGGGKLAADLTLPKLRTRWDSPAVPPDAGGDPARTAALSFPPAGVGWPASSH